jgi:hypothetical protein
MRLFDALVGIPDAEPLAHVEDLAHVVGVVCPMFSLSSILSARCIYDYLIAILSPDCTTILTSCVLRSAGEESRSNSVKLLRDHPGPPG